MKTKSLTIRRSEPRINKLYLYAAQKDKTITALIEDWIDSLEFKEKDTTGFNPSRRISSIP